MTHRTKTRRAPGGRDDVDATGAPRCRRLFTLEQATNDSEDRLQALLDGIATGELEVHRLDDGQIRGLRAIPIIVVTSYALSGDDQKAMAAGCDAYVAKPFSPRQLLATIRGFLGEASG